MLDVALALKYLHHGQFEPVVHDEYLLYSFYPFILLTF